MPFLSDYRAVCIRYHSERSRFMWFFIMFLRIKGYLFHRERLPFSLFAVTYYCLWKCNLQKDRWLVNVCKFGKFTLEMRCEGNIQFSQGNKCLSFL